MDNRSVFSQRLRRLRERRGICRRTLSELLGLSKNTVARYEKGERVPSIETLSKIADLFGVTADYLIGRE